MTDKREERGDFFGHGRDRFFKKNGFSSQENTSPGEQRPARFFEETEERVTGGLLPLKWCRKIFKFLKRPLKRERMFNFDRRGFLAAVMTGMVIYA